MYEQKSIAPALNVDVLKTLLLIEVDITSLLLAITYFKINILSALFYEDYTNHSKIIQWLNV